MSMYFLDDTEDWPEYTIIKDDIHRWEKEHLEVGKKLQEAESAFSSDPANADLKNKIDGFKKKLKEIEKRLDGSLRLYR